MALTWRVTSIGGHANDSEDGCAYDDGMFVGRVMPHRSVSPAPGLWSWSMCVTGFGANYPLHRGLEASKEEAKAAVEGCYERLMNAHPVNRAFARARHEQLRRSKRLWETRGERRLTE